MQHILLHSEINLIVYSRHAADAAEISHVNLEDVTSLVCGNSSRTHALSPTCAMKLHKTSVGKDA